MMKAKDEGEDLSKELAKADEAEEEDDPSFVDGEDDDPSGKGKGVAGRRKKKLMGMPTWTPAEEIKWRAAYPEFDSSNMTFPSTSVRAEWSTTLKKYWYSPSTKIAKDAHFVLRCATRTGYDVLGKKSNVTGSAALFFSCAMIVEHHAIELYRKRHLDGTHLGGIRKDLSSLLSEFATPVNVDEDGNPLYVWIDSLEANPNNMFLKANLKSPSVVIRKFTDGEHLRKLMGNIDGLVGSILKSPAAKAGDGPELDHGVVLAVEFLAQVSKRHSQILKAVLMLTCFLQVMAGNANRLVYRDYHKKGDGHFYCYDIHRYPKKINVPREQDPVFESSPDFVSSELFALLLMYNVEFPGILEPEEDAPGKKGDGKDEDGTGGGSSGRSGKKGGDDDDMDVEDEAKRDDGGKEGDDDNPPLDDMDVEQDDLGRKSRGGDSRECSFILP